MRITVLGAEKSGKTAIVVRYLTGRFIFDYYSGKDFVYKKDVFIASTKVPLEIVDTSTDGNIEFNTNSSDGFVIVYAVDDDNSFKKANQLLAKLVNKSKHLLHLTALVGSKNDLWPHKAVNAVDGKNLADKYGCKHFELSALSCKEGIEEMFHSLIAPAAMELKKRTISLPENRYSINALQNHRIASSQVARKDSSHEVSNIIKSFSKVAFAVTQNGKKGEGKRNSINRIVEKSLDILQRYFGEEDHSIQGRRSYVVNQSVAPIGILPKRRGASWC